MESPVQRDDEVHSESLDGLDPSPPDQESSQEARTSVTSETSAGEQNGRTSEVTDPGDPAEETAGTCNRSGLVIPAAGSKRGTRISRRKNKPKKLVVPGEEYEGSPLDDLKEDAEDLLYCPAEPEMVPRTGADAAAKPQNSCTACSDHAGPSKPRRGRKKKPAENFKKPYLAWQSGDSPTLMFVVPSEEMETISKPEKKKRQKEEEELPEMHWCDICDDVFPSLNDLELHQATHIDDPQEEFDCEECGRVFDSTSELEEHQSKRHGKLRYRCDICGIQYNYQSQFLIHMRAHSGERLFTCDECGREFKHRCSLVIHQRRHVGETPHQCQKCGKMLDTRSALVKHEKMRYCPDCNKCYTHRGFTKHLNKNCVRS